LWTALKVKEVMSRDPIVITETTTIAQIENIFRKYKIWSILVGNSREYVGIITRKDLKNRGKNKDLSTPASAIMSYHILTIDQDEDVISAIITILDKNVNGLAVTNNGLPCGIITKYDIKKKYNPNSFSSQNIPQIPLEDHIPIDQGGTQQERRFDSIYAHKFQIALSFSGKFRDIVEQVANGLANKIGRNNIFYDFFYKAYLAQPNLDLLLQKIYGDNSKLNVIFLSSDYESKEWCGIEFRVIRDLIKKKDTEKIMLLKSDDIDIKELLSIDGYLDIRDLNPPEIVDLIVERFQGIPIERADYGVLSSLKNSSDTTKETRNENIPIIEDKKIEKSKPDFKRSIADITRDTRRLK
jgi:CBS domain-containing protein